MKKILNNGWQLRSEGLEYGPEMAALVHNKSDGWMKTDLPCDVHMPLIENGIIKEPLEADNSFQCEWIEDKSWWFEKIFEITEEIISNESVDLILESLDAEADIFLNGIHLGHHRSAFYPFTLDVRKILTEGENILMIRVSSGLEHVSEKDLSSINFKEHFKKYQVALRDDRRRACVRKPQFVYGWDWTPRVASCGIMKSVYIEAHNKLAIRHVHVATSSISQDRTAELDFKIEIENLHSYATLDAVVKVEMYFKNDVVVRLEQEIFLVSGLNYINCHAAVHNAMLWWPNGAGEPSLYEIKVTASDGKNIDTYPAFKYGIRTIRLDMEKTGVDERRFAFVINGVRIFCKGGNWVPADSIYVRTSEKKYETLITEAKEANFNMLRVWGGGIYEPDIFYEKCDENGIMIWQDFMFACMLYPDDMEWFKREAEMEIDYQTRRLSNHPSIVLWCGNNECSYAFAEWFIHDPKPSYRGGLYCYNIIAPRIVQKNCPEIPYWNGSPYGGEDPNTSNIGDRHHWTGCMTKEDMEEWISPEKYDKLTSRFISEYGYLGPCVKSSTLSYLGEGLVVDMESSIWKHHTHSNNNRNQSIASGIEKHYSDPGNLNTDEYLLLGGLCQGLMLGYAFETMRFTDFCWGSLIWMYNDAWGEIGWSIIDYYLARKPSFYFVKRALAPVKLIMREKDGIITVIAANDTKEGMTVVLEYGYVSFDGNIKDCKKVKVSIKEFERKSVLEFEKGGQDVTRGCYYVRPVSNFDVSKEKKVPEVLPAVLRSCEFRKLMLPETKLVISSFKQEDGVAKFTVTSSQYAHGVHFNLEESMHPSDEYFDLLPGEARVISVNTCGRELLPDMLNPKSVVTGGKVK